MARQVHHVARPYHDICMACRFNSHIDSSITYFSFGAKRGWQHDEEALNFDHAAISWRTGKDGRGWFWLNHPLVVEVAGVDADGEYTV